MNRGTRKPILISCLFAWALILAGCGGTDILIVRDQYWKTIEFDSKTEARIQTAVEESGRSIGYADMPYRSGPQEIATRISDEAPQAAILSPLLSQHAVEVAKLESRRRIIAFSLGSGRAAEDNLTTMVSSRREAFKQAGLLCRRYLRHTGNAGKSVGGLFYSGGNERTSERLAFLEGIGNDLIDRVFIRSFPQQNSINEVNDFLSTTESIGVYIVSMAGLNRDVISSILTRSRAFVIAEWMGHSSGLPYGDRIVAAVKENWTTLFSFGLSRLGPEIIIKATLVPGPAANSPAAAWAGAYFDNTADR